MSEGGVDGGVEPPHEPPHERAEPRPAAPDEERLETLLVEWFTLVDAGESPSPHDLCKDDPALLERFIEIVADDLALESSISRGGARPQPAPQIRNLRDFELLDLLGSGGRGEVYRARQLSLNRFVAVKVLRRETASDARARRRLIREAELTASLEHPHIVPVFAVGEVDGYAYLAMKLLEGPSLDAFIRDPEQPDARLTVLPLREVATLIAKVARGLHAAHLAGVTHRDIKPANIMLDRGEPCILDFGLASGTVNRTQTIDARVSGTLPYMSPEQLCAGGRSTPLDGRTDIYSLGVTLFELVEGNLPFWSEEPAMLIQMVLLKSPPTPVKADRDLRTILERALQKDPQRRFQTAEAFAEDLERYARGEAIQSRPVGVVERAIRLVKRYPRASSGIGVATAVALVLATVLGLRMRREGESRLRSITEVRSELEAGHPIMAERLLASLEERYPADVDCTVLRRELEADLELDRLLDALQQPASMQDPRGNEAVLARLDELDAFSARPDALRAWHIARAYVLAFSDRVDDCRRALAEVTSPTLRAAIECFVDRQPWPWDLPAPQVTESPETYWVTALLLRAADLPPEAQLQWIEQGRERFESDYRLRAQELIWWGNNRRDPGRVLAGLQGMLREGRYPQVVRATMLHQAILSGERSVILRYLRRLEEDYPRATWSQITAAVVLTSLRVLGRQRDVDELRAWAVARWPASFFLGFSEAEDCLARGDFESFDRLVASMREHASTRRQREGVELLVLRRDEGSVDAEALAERARKLVATALQPTVRAEARMILVRSALDSNPVAEPRALLAELERASQEAPTPEVLAEASFSALRLGSADLSRRLVTDFDARVRGGAVVQPATQLERLVVEVYLAAEGGDPAVLAEAVNRALRFEGAELDPAHRAHIEGLRDR